MFIYAIINFLILAAIIWLFGRKAIASIFTKRRDALNAELDEMERLEREDDSLPPLPPVELSLKMTAEQDEALRAVEQKKERDLEHIASQTEQDILELRREEMFRQKDETVALLKERITALFQRERISGNIRIRS